MLGRKVVLLFLCLSLVLGVACESQGFPSVSGTYDVRPKSITFDGQEYAFFWKDASGEWHRAHDDDLKLVEGERTFLEIRNGERILHLHSDEPIEVLAQDERGGYSSFWFPFLIGHTVGSLGGNRPVVIQNPREPAYRYPPTDQIGRGEDLRGSIRTSQPAPPDYSKVRGDPNAVSGAGGGTGAGTAATNKGSGATSGVSGGTGAGTAASSKGTFRRPVSSYSGTRGSPGGVRELKPATSKPPRYSAPKIRIGRRR